MQSLGQVLKQARLHKQLSLDTVSQITKIRLPFLEAIESDDYAIFSSATHAKGFIANYASCLDIDVPRAMALYRREIDQRQPAAVHPKSARLSNLSLRALLGKWQLWLGLAAVGLIVIFFATQIQAVLQPPILELASPRTWAAGFEGTYEIDADTIRFTGHTGPQTVVRLNGEAVALEADYSFETAEIPLGQQTTILVFRATNQFGRSSEIHLSVERKTTSYGPDNLP